MVEQGMSVAESYLVDMMRLRVGPFASGVVGGPFHKLCDLLVTEGKVPAGVKVPQAALLHAFKEAGWVDCGRLGSADFHTKRHIFAVSGRLRGFIPNPIFAGWWKTLIPPRSKVIGIHQQRTPNQRG